MEVPRLYISEEIGSWGGRIQNPKWAFQELGHWVLKRGWWFQKRKGPLSLNKSHFGEPLLEERSQNLDFEGNWVLETGWRLQNPKRPLSLNKTYIGKPLAEETSQDLNFEGNWVLETGCRLRITK